MDSGSQTRRCELKRGRLRAARRDAELVWYAVQNLCPHDRRQILSRGLTGDAQGEPKVACPLHKNAFSLRTGEHLGGGSAKGEWTLETFPVKEAEGLIFLEFDTSRLEPLSTGVNHEPGHAHGPS